MLHVIPDDGQTHVTTTAGCWCGAQLQPAARGDGSCRPAMVHNGTTEPAQQAPQPMQPAAAR